jgi:hypothetical protein
MQDRPTVFELLKGIKNFLDAEIVPNTDGRRQFLARVASNTLTIVERELALEEEQLAREWRSLQELLGAEPEPERLSDLRAAVRRRTEELCARIRAGDADEGPWAEAVAAHVRATVDDKMSVTNPGYMAGGA